MSSIAAEAVVNINLDIDLDAMASTGITAAAAASPSDKHGTGTRPTSYTSVDLYTPDSDLKKDPGGYFARDMGCQKSSNNAEAGPSSAGLVDDGYDYFSTVPVLEKGNNNGHEESSGISLAPCPAPTFAILPFVLDDSPIKSEGGWAGWTCVAGSWLICKSLPFT